MKFQLICIVFLQIGICIIVHAVIAVSSIGSTTATTTATSTTKTIAAASVSSSSQYQQPLSSSPPPNMIVVGGSSGMGKAAALETIRHGGKVMLVSRSIEKLQHAKDELLNVIPNADISIFSVDTTNEQNVIEFAKNYITPDTWDSLIITAAGKAVHGPFSVLDSADSQYMMEHKFWNAYYCAKHIHTKLRVGGSIIFTAGVLNRRPGMNCSPLAIANGALEGLTRSLALELGPTLRVNCLSPGFTNTERFQHLSELKRQEMFENTAASLPLQRIGSAQDMGEALYYLATASFVTGIVLDVDGGHTIRQYANPNNDPMRQK